MRNLDSLTIEGIDICFVFGAVCANAVAADNPSCKHMGTIKAENTTIPEQCSECDCPEEWAGPECGREFSLLSNVYL